MFGLLKNLRRRRLLQRPVPDSWLEAVCEFLPIFERLPPEEARSFLHHLKILVWEKHWVAVRDFELTEEVQVIIAAQGARMARGLPLSAYDRLKEFVIYGEDFLFPEDEMPGPVHGEAHHYGTVVLSWPAVLEGLDYPCAGYNPVLHELAHILDMESGFANGTPLLHSGKDYEAWEKVFQKYYDQMRARPEESFLDLYGAENEAEFFAVATEAFFELPDLMAYEAPDLFGELRRYYRIAPLIIDCSCESHDEFDGPEGFDPDQEYEEVGRPFIMPKDPLDGSFF